MSFGTTVSSFEIETDEKPRPPHPAPSMPSANTITAQLASETAASTTNLLPESILGNWGAINRASMSVRMYGDLVRLASVGDGWTGPGSRRLRSESLRSFLIFWSLVFSEAEEPEITLTSNGTIYAEWFASDRKRLDANFSGRDVVFGLFSGNKIIEGVEDVATLAQILKLHPFKPLSWSKR